MGLARGIDRFSHGLGILTGLITLLMIGVGLFNVIGRFVDRYAGTALSSNSLLEAQWYLFAWSFLAAAGYTLLHREHVRIDVLNSHLSKRAQVWVDIIGFAFFLTPLCIVVLYLSTPLAIQMYQTGETSGNSGGLIRWPVWAAMPIGFTLLMLQGWSEIIKRLAFLQGQGPDPMGRLADKSAEEDLAEALRARATADTPEASATSDAAPQR